MTCAAHLLRRLALGAAPTFLLALAFHSPAAQALPFEVEEWSITAGEVGVPPDSFSDDFEDGVFDAGSYQVPCGSVEAGDESGGILALGRPAAGAPCSSSYRAQIVASNLGFQSPAEVKARYLVGVPEIGESFGLQIVSEDGSDLVGIAVARAIIGSTDTLAVILFDELFVATGDLGDILGNAVLSLFPPGFPAATIDLELEIFRDADLLFPTGRFSLDGGSFLNVLAGAGEGALDPELSEAWRAALAVSSPLPEPRGGLLAVLALLGLVRRATPRRARGRVVSSPRS